ncbi:MFS transporter [Prosthecobacter sp.]|uniref:MFS transporter n=1 Tax=Prosthecobacter sp. TaxID=1965333 RepID=UPI0024895D1E|nr:MFS transporter [Prosthecobacter sp.]MDI1314514.1 MFS transporter [Prosthecobacter sp.]
MHSTLKIKLSIFMFLQYFIWSCWYMTLGSYLGTLGFSGTEIGATYGAFAWGAILSPFIVGLIADRFFASEKIIAVLGIAGGLVMFYIPQLKTFGSVYPTLILYCTLYAPTLALGNSISMTHLTDAKKDFPFVKIFSAVGWIAGGVVLSQLKAEQSALQYYVAGGTSLLFGLFALTLPHTPPKKKGQNVPLSEVLGLDALALLKKPTFAIFILCMFLICIPLYFYFVNMGTYLTQLNWADMAQKMTLAQVSDIVFLMLLPLMLKKLGYKKTIFLGILSWVVRYFMLSASAASSGTVLIFGAILLHGVCYDFLFIAGQLYVDSEASERTRGAAQGLIAIILWGFGSLVGTYLAGYFMDQNKLATPNGAITHDWSAIWATPAWIAVSVLVVFVIFFREPKKSSAA